MGAKTKDPSPDRWDARDDQGPAHRGRYLRSQRRLKAKHSVPVPVEPHHCHNFCEELAVAAQAKHALLQVAHSSATASSKSNSTGVALRTASRLCGCIPQAYSSIISSRELRSPIPRCWRRRLWRSWLASRPNTLGHDDSPYPFATLAVLRLRCFSFASGSSHTPLCSANMSDMLNVQPTLSRTTAQIFSRDPFRL